jgi:hypothetical protein
MRASKRQSRAVLVVLASAAAAFFVLPASPAAAVAFPNACKNSVDTGENTQLDVELNGNSPAQVQPNESFTLSNINLNLAVPGAVFVAGYNLGLVSDGETLDGTAEIRIEGTHTVEGAQSTGQVPVSVGPVDISDPDGVPTTGDESAAPANVPAAFPDQTWTAGPTGAIIEFREDSVQPVTPSSGGALTISVNVGLPIPVTFRCDPGSVDESGGPPGVISFTDPAPTFAATEILGPPETTITKGPKDKIKTKKKKVKARFEFTSSEPGSSFECSLDDKAFAPCTSPHKVKVKKGKHKFEVRAKDQAGETDPTPASDSWKVKRKKK